MTSDQIRTPRVLLGMLTLALARPWRPMYTMRLMRDYLLVLSSDLFDPEWYLDHNPDANRRFVEPAAHYLRSGASELRDPGPRFSTRAYLASNPDVATLGMNPLVHFLRHGRAEHRRSRPSRVRLSSLSLQSPSGPTDAPLRTFRVPGTGRRVTLLIDDMGAFDTDGRTTTAVVVSALLARRLDAGLRVATRVHAPERRAVRDILASQEVEWTKDIAYAFCDGHDPEARLDIADGDMFVTTSWWTTSAVREVLPPRHLIYLVQEDERLRHAPGDLSLRAGEVMADPSLRVLVSTQLLWDHLVAEGISDLDRRGAWFEPAFPAMRSGPRSGAAPERLSLLFDARPADPSALYRRGVDVLDMALSQGVIDPREWSITFRGPEPVPVTLAQDVSPRLVRDLSWDESAKLLGGTDVGLSLAYGPQPGYGVLEMAATGAMVVTNRYARKDSLDRYSPAIITADVGVDDLVAGLAAAVALANDGAARRERLERLTIERDWSQALGRAIESLANGL